MSQQWINAKDKLPEVIDNTYAYCSVSEPVLVFNNKEKIVGYVVYSKEDQRITWRSNCGDVLRYVTHWMELPKEPEVGLESSTDRRAN